MNLPTILVLTLVVLLFGGLVFKSVRDKKQGKHSCSCGGDCSACAGQCHEKF